MNQICLEDCPACGGRRLEPMPGGEAVFVGPFGRDMATEFAGCDDCGFLFQKRPLDQDSLMAYYAASGQRRTRDLEEIDRAVFRQQIRFLASGCETAPKRALEIGADTGTFLDAVRATWDCDTFYDEANVEACRVLGQTGHRAAEAGNGDGSARFDVIILRHVLEHAPAPLGWLQSFHERLTEKGALFIEVPDWTFLDRDTGFLSFEHVSYFTQPTLSRLLQRAGFAVVRQEMALNRTYPNARHRVLRVLAQPLPVDARKDFRQAMRAHILRGKEGKYERINRLYQDRARDPNPALYGASWLAEQILRKTDLGQERVAAVFDIDEKKHGRRLHGVPIRPPADIASVRPSSILIASSSEEPIRRRLSELGFDGRVLAWSELDGEGAL